MRWQWFVVLLLAACNVAPPAPLSSSTPLPTATETPLPAATPTPSGPLTEIKLACLSVWKEACQKAVDESSPLAGVKPKLASFDVSTADTLLKDRTVLGAVGPSSSADAFKLAPG